MRQLNDKDSLFKLQLTRLARGVTFCHFAGAMKSYVTTHTPRERRDNPRSECCTNKALLQFTRLVRGVTIAKTTPATAARLQLTRLVRGVTNLLGAVCGKDLVTTHTPRERRDASPVTAVTERIVTTHTPRERRD